jgi:outer membrane protein assembly factor BamB
MKNRNLFIIIFSYFLLSSCSFDTMSGIWDGSESEKKRIASLKDKQNSLLDSEKIYTSKDIYYDEIASINSIILNKPKNNQNWQMSNLNQQNFKGNIYLSGVSNIFLKKKVGKKKFSFSKPMMSPVIYNNYIILSDDTGTIYNISKNGKVNWKKNIYKKIYKKIYKNLSLSIYENVVFISDNVGFIYSLDIETGKILWIKNHGIPIKSKIKLFDNKIYLINQDNRIICLDSASGNKIWDVRTVASFIKSQNFSALAISKKGDLFVLNSSGDLLKLSALSGQIFWALNVTPSLYAHDKDFFKSSDIVIENDNIYFSTTSSLFSYNSKSGFMNWQLDINSTSTPIIDGNNVFLLSNNGFFANIDKSTGKLIWLTDVLKILKKKKQDTNISGFILGSGKVYITTRNGFLIISSATIGKTESFIKIGGDINIAPIISDGSLYVLTENSRLFGFN